MKIISKFCVDDCIQKMYNLKKKLPLQSGFGRILNLINECKHKSTKEKPSERIILLKFRYVFFPNASSQHFLSVIIDL